jgi:4-aminobutyrate aminotransferase-like enzyme/murein DD-endopeptidase MepM/ murein hydrolase activator NlpD
LNDYRDEREKSAWVLLRKLKKIAPEYVEARLRYECGFSVSRESDASLAWIKENTAQLTKPVTHSFKKENYLVFDLGIGSEELIGYDWEDKKAVSDHLLRRMKDEGASMGITKYDEARLFFNSDRFKVPNPDYNEFRNVHLGMDIIMEVGTPIQAVLDGKIHHIVQNEAENDLKNSIIVKHEPIKGICFYTIYGNVKTDLMIGVKVTKGQTIGQLVFIDNWSPHLHFQCALDLVGFDENFPVTTSSENFQRAFWKAVSPNPNIILQIPEKQLVNPHYGTNEIIAKRSKFLGKNQKYYYQNPINIVRSRAQFLYDENGRKYLDSLNNVTHVGHCHPKVVEAITKQSQLLNTNSRLVYEGIVRYAERLVDTLPDPLSVCYFVCTGSEANDLALRLARHYTGQHDMLILDGAYHGNTTAVEQISPNRFDGPGGKGAMPFIHKIPQPNLYRGLFQYDDEKAGEKYGLEVQRIISELQAAGKGIAGMIAESLMGTAGQLVLPDGFLKHAFDHIRAAGGVCISDEVQVGFGRMGEKFWCFKTQDVVPDIVVMGKPIANGFPMAMVVTTPEIAEAYNTGMKYFNTFGGNPVACAAGLAVLDVIEEEKLQQHAGVVGDYFLKSLVDLKKQHKIIGDVRGKGLYLGIEFVKDHETKTPAKAENYYISERMKEKGIISYPNGNFDNCLKIKPPLVFAKQDVDYFVNTLDNILNESVLQS